MFLTSEVTEKYKKQRQRLRSMRKSAKKDKSYIMLQTLNLLLNKGQTKLQLDL